MIIDLTGQLAGTSGLQLLRNVSSINNTGQIVGSGIGPDGHVVGVLLTPVGSSPADIDNNCVVDVQDLFALLPCFGQAGDPPCNLADINHDGTVNVLDLIVLLLNWG